MKQLGIEGNVVVQQVKSRGGYGLWRKVIVALQPERRYHGLLAFFVFVFSMILALPLLQLTLHPFSDGGVPYGLLSLIHI